MAKVAVLTDRLPNDPSWKGAYTWEIIRQLAESQHEVRVFMTDDPDQIPFTHSRLTLARPAWSFGAERLPKWAQALIAFQPNVIHTFALKPSSAWPSLTVWPYLDAVCKVLPGAVKRVATLFDSEDFSPSHPAKVWYDGSYGWTVFSAEAEVRARRVFNGRVDCVPLEDLVPAGSEDFESFEERGYTFIPAPVSEWTHRQHGLLQLADHLTRHPDTTAQINGGWGDLPLSERRRGWATLSEVSSRVRLLEPQSLERFTARARAASRIWIEGVPHDSWRFLISVKLAQFLSKELVGEGTASPLVSGSTANSLSRLYLS